MVRTADLTNRVMTFSALHTHLSELQCGFVSCPTDPEIQRLKSRNGSSAGQIVAFVCNQIVAWDANLVKNKLSIRSEPPTNLVMLVNG